MWGYKLIIDKLGINKFSITFEITRLHHLPLIWNISVIHWPDCIKIKFSNVSCSNELCCPLAENCFSVTFKKVWPSATTNYIVLWPKQFVLLNRVNLSTLNFRVVVVDHCTTFIPKYEVYKHISVQADT